jgi:hypothetical protein
LALVQHQKLSRILRSKSMKWCQAWRRRSPPCFDSHLVRPFSVMRPNATQQQIDIHTKINYIYLYVVILYMYYIYKLYMYYMKASVAIRIFSSH